MLDSPFPQPLSTSSLVFLLGLGPSTSYSIHLFNQSSSSFQNTCPYHHSLFRCSTNVMSPIPNLPQMIVTQSNQTLCNRNSYGFTLSFLLYFCIPCTHYSWFIFCFLGSCKSLIALFVLLLYCHVKNICILQANKWLIDWRRNKTTNEEKIR